MLRRLSAYMPGGFHPLYQFFAFDKLQEHDVWHLRCLHAKCPHPQVTWKPSLHSPLALKRHACRFHKATKEELRGLK